MSKLIEHKKVKWKILSEFAWKAREMAVAEKTKVGAALVSSNGNIFSGCNIEQLFRNKDIHAEVCAISKMVSEGDEGIIAIIVVAERDRFTPCGTCMDWIFQFGDENTLVGYQKLPESDITVFEAKTLMPHYPK